MTDAIHTAEYASNGRFYEESTAILGVTPTRFSAGGKDGTMRIAIGQCSLDAIPVPSSDQGVAANLLGDDPDELARDLQDCLPEVQLISGDKTCIAHVEIP